MSKETWLERQILSAKKETENWSASRKEAMRIKERDNSESSETQKAAKGENVEKKLWTLS